MIKTDIINTLYERNDENDKLFTCSCRSKCKRRKSVIKYDFYDSLLCCYFPALYFFLIRPNSKKKKEEAQLRNSLEIGDEITTIGGIMGRVVAIKDDEDAIIIETGSDRVKMKFKKWCISTVDTVKEQPQQAGQPEKKGFFGFGKKKDSDETKATKE